MVREANTKLPCRVEAGISQGNQTSDHHGSMKFALVSPWSPQYVIKHQQRHKKAPDTPSLSKDIHTAVCRHKQPCSEQGHPRHVHCENDCSGLHMFIVKMIVQGYVQFTLIFWFTCGRNGIGETQLIKHIILTCNRFLTRSK